MDNIEAGVMIIMVTTIMLAIARRFDMAIALNVGAAFALIGTMFYGSVTAYLMATIAISITAYAFIKAVSHNDTA